MWVNSNKICETPQNPKTNHQLTASTLLKHFKPHRSFFLSFFRKNIKLAQLGTELDMMSTGVISALFHFCSYIFGISSRVRVLLIKGTSEWFDVTSSTNRPCGSVLSFKVPVEEQRSAAVGR